MSDTIIKILAQRVKAGEASRGGLEFARFISRVAPDESEGVILGAYLACAAIEDAHTCISLDPKALSDTARAYGAGDLDVSAISPGIESSRIAGHAGDDLPLITHDGKLYLHRYFSYEQTMAERLEMRAATRCSPEDLHDAAAFAKKLFPRGAVSPDWQKIAVFNALFTRLVIISGGPGTGKTRTVTALMALMAATSRNADLEIAMCAPTGKAAARLTEAVLSATDALEIPDDIKKRIPSQARTLHRLLGAGRNTGRFRHNRENPLSCHVLIMDEASMVDLPMMVHLMEALRDDTTLVMLGDRDQLASVEAGSVLRDICEGIERFGHSQDFIDRCRLIDEDVTDLADRGSSMPPPLRDCIITLKHSYRFSSTSGIASLATYVNVGDYTSVKKLLRDAPVDGIELAESKGGDATAAVAERLLPHARRIMDASSVDQALAHLNEFKILCAMRQGPAGVEAVNGLAHAMVSNMGFQVLQGMYRGLPVIINRNDYMLDLYNGDTGIVWPDETGRLRVWFRGEGGLRSFSPSRLPSHDAAWAITVHRSQGSEFDRVLFLLPPRDSIMPGRELLYTAITRAREHITILGGWDDLKACIERRTWRNSGLAKRLWEID